jgi:hypothetical protein
LSKNNLTGFLTKAGFLLLKFVYASVAT